MSYFDVGTRYWSSSPECVTSLNISLTLPKGQIYTQLVLAHFPTRAGQPFIKSHPQFQIFSVGGIFSVIRIKFFLGVDMAVIAGTESLDAPLDQPREQGEDRTNLIINYLPQVVVVVGVL